MTDGRPNGTEFDARIALLEGARREAEEALLASEQRFHLLVDAVTDYAIFLLDATGRIATWNEGAKRIKGYEADEIVGKHFSLFYTAEDRASGKPARVLDTVRREGRFEEENWRLRKDGTRVWASVVITALRGASGEITGFAKVTRDLTSKREAQANARKLYEQTLARSAAESERNRVLSLFERVPAIVNFLRGPDLVFEIVHPKATEVLGGRELVGRPLLEAVPEYRDQEVYARLRRVYETGETSSVQESPVRLQRHGVEVLSYWNSVHIAMRDAAGHIEGVMTFDVDVTESVLARQELSRALRQAEEARAEERRLRHEADLANQAKDDFLATVSHELRTPLNAILGWTSTLRTRKPPAEFERPLAAIERNARRQARLIEDVLDVSRIISGKLTLNLAPTTVAETVEQAIESVAPAADAKQIRIKADLDASLFLIADAERLQQVVWNLLSNAVKFTPKRGEISVQMYREGSDFCLCVRDTGEGITAEALPVIFEPFRQADGSTTRRHGGLGLGLAIVHQLVAAHGGTVRAESEGPGKGATFTVTLPARGAVPAVAQVIPPLAPAPGQHANTLPRLDGLSVLVVDDEEDALELIGHILRDQGARVSTATNAQQALDALPQLRPDVIVSDVGMPDMDGFTLLRRVRSLPAHRGGRTPALALTAYARREDAQDAFAAGFQMHAAKPIEPAQLVTMLANLGGLSLEPATLERDQNT